MARPRTGHLGRRREPQGDYPLKITIDEQQDDGTMRSVIRRGWIRARTDREAERLRVLVVAAANAGKPIDRIEDFAPSRCEVVQDYLNEFCEDLKDASGGDENGNVARSKRAIENHASSILNIPPKQVTREMIYTCYKNMALGTYTRGDCTERYTKETVRNLHKPLLALFDELVHMGVIDSSPVDHATFKRVCKRFKVREDPRPRMILSDEQCVTFYQCEISPLDGKPISRVQRTIFWTSRCGTGMRGVDIKVLTWPMFQFEAVPCTFDVYDVKNNVIQKYNLPDILGRPLFEQWVAAGRPRDGLIFPVQRGNRRGERRSFRSSFASSLPRLLFRSGIWTFSPIELTVRPARGRLARLCVRRSDGVWVAPDPRDPIYFPTERSLPVEFHSCRRAVVTGMRRARVPDAEGMRVTRHSSAKSFERYAMTGTEPVDVPSGALPMGGYFPAVPVSTPSPTRTPPVIPSGGETIEHGTCTISSAYDRCVCTARYIRNTTTREVSRRYAPTVPVLIHHESRSYTLRAEVSSESPTPTEAHVRPANDTSATRRWRPWVVAISSGQEGSPSLACTCTTDFDIHWLTEERVDVVASRFDDADTMAGFIRRGLAEVHGLDGASTWLVLVPPDIEDLAPAAPQAHSYRSGLTIAA